MNFDHFFIESLAAKIRHEMRKKSVANYQIMLAASTSQTNMLVKRDELLVKRDELPLNDANPVMRVPISGYIEINKKRNRPCMFGVIKRRVS